MATARVAADQKWHMLEMPRFLRKSSQMWVGKKWYDSALVGKKWTLLQKCSLNKHYVSSKPKPTLKFLTEGAVAKKGECQSGMCLAFWEAVFWRHNTNHSAQGSIIQAYKNPSAIKPLDRVEICST